MPVHPENLPVPPARWPDRLVELCVELRRDGTTRREALLSELWCLVNAVLCRYVRYNSRSRWMDPEDVRDIASEKSLAFIQRVADPGHEFVAESPARVCSYFATVARNGVVDHFRRLGREQDSAIPAAARPASPEDGLNRGRYAGALKDAVLSLGCKPRMIWFFRVMLEMSSEEIGRHPDISMRASAVDVALSRARRSIRSAMQAQGYSPLELPPGTLAVLWEAFQERNEGEEKDEEP